MKKIFTKNISVALVICFVLVSYLAQAQNLVSNDNTVSEITKTNTVIGNPTTTKVDKGETVGNTKSQTMAAADTAWKPVRRLWGYSFGDFYYNDHADATNRGSETQYNGVPTYRNAFQFRRIYLGYDYEIDRRFTAEVLLASEPNANTGVNGTTSIQNGDNLVDGKMGFYIKNLNLRYREIWNGTDLVVGEMATPGFALNEKNTNAPTSLSEATWGYRFIEKTITDFHKTNSYDLGASLQGTFDPATKNFGYVFMVGNNSTASLLSAANPNTGFYKIFYGDLWAKLFNKQIYVDIYGDYLKTSPATATIGAQSHSLYKIFAAYVNPKLSVGVEAYTQQITNGVTDATTKAPADATVNGLSVWVKGAIVKDKVNFFARYDGYNPSTNFINTDTYTVNTNFGSYNPTVKEKFYTLGLDFTPTKNVHFSPNLWLVQYADQRASTTTGYVADDHTLVYRLTFYFVFGK